MVKTKNESQESSQDVMESRAVAFSERASVPFLFLYDPVLTRENLDFSEKAGG